MLPSNWQELYERFKEMMKENPRAFDTTFEALEKLRCLTLLWGLEYPENVQFQDVCEKRHTLLAYKYLGLLWFDELPASEDSKLKLWILGEIPRTVTPEKVIETFRRGDEALLQWCGNISRPNWIDRRTKSMMTSLKSFPLKARS